MSKLTVLGLIFLFAGFLLLGYQGVMALMGSDRTASNFAWINISPADLLGKEAFDWINSLSFSMAPRIIMFLVELPLFLWMFSMACLCFIIEAFRGGKT